MNDRENRRYEMFGRVATFGQDHTADFTATSKARTHLKNLADITAQLVTARAHQGGGSATAKSVLVDALRLDLQNIARTANAMEPDEPGMTARFPLPDSASPGPVTASGEAFLAQFKALPTDDAATTAAKAALVAKFIAHELPADFVQDLSDDLDAIANAQDDRESDDEEGLESTAAVGRLIRAGMKEVNYLDAIMRNKYTRYPDKLRAWDAISRIQRAPKREKKPESPTPAGPQ